LIQNKIKELKKELSKANPINMVTTGEKILEEGNCKESEILIFARKHRTQNLKGNCKNS
jgi:hypothetical protein